MKGGRLLALWAGVLAIALSLGAGGCAGPKRLPPLAGDRPPTDQPAVRVPSLVGVGLVEKESSLAFSASGTCLLLDGRSGKRLAKLEGPQIQVSCRLSDGQVSWQSGRLSGTAAAVVLQPVDPRHRVHHGDFEYRGEFLVLPTPGFPGLTLVNNVEMENYLRGVVPWEIGRHGRECLAALAAQAVAARTYALSHLGSRSSRGFDVYASIMDQVYRGSADEDPLCNEAIDQTAGLVLRHAGTEIEAFYSACCGGVSSTIEEVWARGAQPYLISHPDSRGSGDPFCADYRYYHWREEWTVGRLEEILQTTLPEYVAHMSVPGRAGWAGTLFSPRRDGNSSNRPGELLDLEILERTTSGRVSRLAIRTEAGEYQVRGDRVRWVLRPASGNPAILRSALFEVQLVHREGRLTQVAARGKGYGHGIGLCQAGSLAMAARGHSFREILAHYYPGTVLKPASSGKTTHRK